MPRWLIWLAVTVTAFALVPLAMVARARTTTSPHPRLHVVPDMDQQPRFKAQAANPLFADGRAMRPPVAGTVARGELDADSTLVTGRAGVEWTVEFPFAVTETVIRRGQQRYDVYCAPCHGLGGYGDGIVGARAERLQEGTWTPASSFHTDLVRGRPVGHLYNTVAHGIRNMPAYGAQIGVNDRWAVVAYVRALQRSQFARPEDVPAELRAQLR
ncbi:MAG: c-type cytochrome [Acidobacteriota bacterium]